MRRKRSGSRSQKLSRSLEAAGYQTNAFTLLSAQRIFKFKYRCWPISNKKIQRDMGILMIYVASRVRHAGMWQKLRATYPINSTWIDEAGDGETADLAKLWERIHVEVLMARAIVLYVEPNDFPLKGALIEVGMALAVGKPIFVSACDVELEERSLRPLGSWLHHPRVVLDQGEWSIDRMMKQAASVC